MPKRFLLRSTIYKRLKCEEFVIINQYKSLLIVTVIILSMHLRIGYIIITRNIENIFSIEK